MEKISSTTELTFCCVCQEEWSDILSKPKPIPIEYKWKTSQDCDHKWCTACYSRLLFEVNDDGMMSTKTVRNCPYCHTAILNKHLDEGITLTKELLLKYFFAVNQAYKDLQRTRQNEKIQNQEKIIASLRTKKTEYEKEISLLRKDNEALHAKINRILDDHDEMKEKCEFYKESSMRDRMMNQHAHLLLEHCYHSMEDMKKKHLMQIATQQHDTDILLRQIHQEKKQVTLLHKQILTYQDRLVAKATSHRVDVELKDVQII